MEKLNQNEMHLIAQLFDGWEDTMIWSCLQGVMGEAWVNRKDDIKSAVIFIADFGFLAGEVNQAMVTGLLDACERSWLLVVAGEEAWHRAIEASYEGAYDRFMRYAIKKEKDVFDRAQLEAYVETIPEGFMLKQIDESIYMRLKQDEWGKDLCGFFKDYKQFEALGLGYVIMKDEEIVSGASSYSAYKGGIEIEIDTREEYRRQGLARVCGARLILECLARGLYPSWDAANMGSVALSEQLGYHFSHEYITYAIKRVEK